MKYIKLEDVFDILNQIQDAQENGENFISSARSLVNSLAVEGQVEPEEFEWCHDCKEYDSNSHCCHRWTKVIRQTVKELREGQTEAHWIPVTERLPNPAEETYWVCTDTGYQYQCRWTNANPFWTNLTTEWHWNFFDIPQYSKVVAWRMLPKPYEEKDET